MRVVPDPEEQPQEEQTAAETRVPIRTLIWRAAEAYFGDELGPCADAMKQVADELNGPHFSCLRALRNTVDELILETGRMPDAVGLREEVVSEALHRMIYARSELLKNQTLRDGRACGGYDSRSAAARVLRADEALPDGWSILEQPMSPGNTVYIGWDPRLVQEPFVSMNDFPPDVLQTLYEAGAERVEGDTMCRLFVAPAGGLAPKPAEQGVVEPTATVDL